MDFVLFLVIVVSIVAIVGSMLYFLIYDTDPWPEIDSEHELSEKNTTSTTDK